MLLATSLASLEFGAPLRRVHVMPRIRLRKAKTHDEDRGEERREMCMERDREMSCV
jgi:hypothetical protein